MKKTSNILCILNPNASKGQAITKVDKIKESFRKRNQSVDIIFTSQRKQAITLALQGADEGYDVIIAAGGDGTVNEVANGILKSDKSPSFGIIPIGRGNDFAYTTSSLPSFIIALGPIINAPPILLPLQIEICCVLRLMFLSSTLISISYGFGIKQKQCKKANK